MLNKDNFFKIWAFVIPIMSIALIPTIKGTIPSHIMAFFSVFIILSQPYKLQYKYFCELLIIFMVFMFITLSAQYSLLISNVKLDDIILLHDIDDTVYFRKSLFTQSLYLFVGIITYLFVKLFYSPKWDQCIFIGGAFLAIYGMYEWIYFLIFGVSGDFLSNRLIGDLDNQLIGSFFQTVNLGGIHIERLKSLTGEPSMYAMTMLPFWIYAQHKKQKFFAKLFLLTLILTTSTTAFLGMISYWIVNIYYKGINYKLILKGLFTFGTIYFLLFDHINDFFDQMILMKLYAENESGTVRWDEFYAHIEFFTLLPIINKIFGIGFGYIRSTDLFTTLLVNVGMGGLLIYSVLFLYPILKLKNNYENVGLKSTLIVLYIIMMIAVPEFAYPTTWMFLGIAYNRIQKT